ATRARRRGARSGTRARYRAASRRAPRTPAARPSRSRPRDARRATRGRPAARARRPRGARDGRAGCGAEWDARADAGRRAPSDRMSSRMIRRISTKWVLTVLAAVMLPFLGFAWFVDYEMAERHRETVRYYL